MDSHASSGTPPGLTGATLGLGGAITAVLSVLSFSFAAALGADHGASNRGSAHRPPPPLGLPAAVPSPPDNPPTPQKVELGRRLFFDPRLSANETMSCAMCHLPSQGFASNELRTAVGIHGRSGRRNAPSLYNVAFQRALFHDGRAATLEEQIEFPLTNPAEMGNRSLDEVVARVRLLPGFEASFQRAFGRGVGPDTLRQAMASYERALLSADSPFDRWYFGGNGGAVNDEVRAGFEVFSGKGGCASCHLVGESFALFTDGEFHNNGAAGLQVIPEGELRVEIAPALTVLLAREKLNEILDPPAPDLGRYEVTGAAADRFRFKTPPLRNVALTAPYMHNGAVATLSEVIEYYDRGATGIEGQDPRVRPLALTTAEKAALAAFLRSLTASNVRELGREPRTNRR